MNNGGDFFIVLFLGIIGGFGIGMVAGSHAENGRMQQQAIAHYAGHYNPNTASFEWNTPSVVVVTNK